MVSPVSSHEYLSGAVSAAASLLAAAASRLDDNAAEHDHRGVRDDSWSCSITADCAALVAAVTDVTTRVHAHALTRADVAGLQECLWRLRLTLENAPPRW